MAAIRDIDRLKPELAKRTRDFLAELRKRGIAVIVLETDRTVDTQHAYYALEEVNTLRKKAGLYLLT